MKSACESLCFVAFLVVTNSSFPSAVAQSWEIRRVGGGLLQVQTRDGLNLIIQPDQEPVFPEHLKAQHAFVLGTEFDRTFLPVDGKSPIKPLRRDGGEPVPPNVISIESVKIGVKTAGIQLKADGLNIVFASVELLSDQGWITTQRDQDINLLVLTFQDAAKLNTTRMNLWVGLVKSQQILLNPTKEMTLDSAKMFSDSIAKQRVLSTDVLPVLTLPRRDLVFGDRQIILLKAPD